MPCTLPDDVPGRVLGSAPEPAPVAVVDVHYEERGAVAACAVAPSWRSADPCEERVAYVAGVLPYRPGAFFERELPCLVSVLALVRSPLGAVVVDGYVDLDERGTPGLGAQLHAHFARAIAVVGVAKTAYRGSTFATPVLRGSSRRPLFVTARGIPVADAARLVRGMHGAHRIPTLLARVDALTRANEWAKELPRVGAA
jgi:deoxyribonuclease V